MAPATTIISPILHLDHPPLPSMQHPGMASYLATLDGAAPGDAIGFALCHGIGERYIGGSATEFGCVFVGTGDPETCDAAVMTMSQNARACVAALKRQWLSRRDLARTYAGGFGLRGGEFETLHFRHFTVLMLMDPEALTISRIEIFMIPPETRQAAEQRHAELRALFRFQCEWHTMLRKYRVEVPALEDLLAAPRTKDRG